MNCLPPLDPRDLDEIVAAVGDWSGLRGASVLLTGATGFFGSWLVESFLHARRALSLDATLVGLSRDPSRFLASRPHLVGAEGLELLAGDVRTFSVGSRGFTHAIHAATAASAALNEAHPLEMLDTIVDGTRHALDVARAQGVSRVLLTSSGAVYGRQPPTVERVAETHACALDPLAPRAAYGEGKRLAELLAGIYTAHRALPTVVARGFAFVGPHLSLDTHFAIGNFIADALAGRAITVQGDGTPLRSYLYASDMTAWLWSMLLCGTPGRAYNHGAEDAVSIGDLARLIGRMYDVPVTVVKRAAEGVNPERYVPSTERARSELGLRARVGLEDGIARTVRWHRQRLTP